MTKYLLRSTILIKVYGKAECLFIHKGLHIKYLKSKLIYNGFSFHAIHSQKFIFMSYSSMP